MANNAKLPDLLTLLQAGINPKTGLPLALGDNKFKKDMKALLRVIDEQDAVNRYTWYNLPCDISSEELERLLYYKGQLCFFYFGISGCFCCRLRFCAVRCGSFSI